MKKVLSILFLIGAGISVFSSSSSAHGIISEQTRETDKYKVTMRASADGTEIDEGVAATYVFTLTDKFANENVPYGAARVGFSGKNQSLIFSSLADGTKESYPFTRVEAAMPTAGDYTIEVLFYNQARDMEPLATAKFDLNVVTRQASGNPLDLNYIWAALAAMVIGLGLGWVIKSKRNEIS